MDQPTLQEVKAQQGTRLNETPPWESYGSEMDTKLDPKLSEAVNEYAKHRYAESKSSEAKEELHRQKELSSGVAKEYQFLHPEEYAEEGPRIGRVLSHAEFITKLRDECNVKCWYRDHPQPGKITLLYGDSFGNQPPQVACWVQAGYMPEYSFVRFDDHDVPIDERRRGWRTCLLQMILKGIVSEATVDKVFGKATGPASERYNRTLHGVRNEYKD